MSTLAVFLVAVGIADICRRLTDRRWPPLCCGPLAVLGCTLVSGLWHLGDIVLGVIGAAATVGWMLLCARTERRGAGQVAPLLLFGTTLAVLGVLSGWASPVSGLVGRWLPWVGLTGELAKTCPWTYLRSYTARLTEKRRPGALHGNQRGHLVAVRL